MGVPILLPAESAVFLRFLISPSVQSHGKRTGFLTPLPHAWHSIYGGTAPQTLQGAKKNPSKTKLHQPQLQRPTRLISSPQPGHINEFLVFSSQKPKPLPTKGKTLYAKMKGALMSQSATLTPNISCLKFHPLMSRASAFEFSYLVLYCPHFPPRYWALKDGRGSVVARFL